MSLASWLRRAGAAPSISDPFTRSVPSGLGTTPEGYAYSVLAGAFSVDGAQAIAASASGSGALDLATLSPGYSDVDLAADITRQGGDALFARVQDASNYFALIQRVDASAIMCNYSTYAATCGAHSCQTCSYGAFDTCSGCNGCAGSCTCTYQCNSGPICTFGAGGCHSTGGSCQLACGTSYAYTAYLYRVLGGAATSLWNGSRTMVRPRLVVHGTTLDVYDGATLLTSVTDTNLVTATKHGIGLYGGLGNVQGAPTFDNLTLAPAA